MSSILADEHVPRVFVTALRSSDYDVVYAHERHGQATDDAELLADCAETGRLLVTNDRDFADLGGRHDHAGIVIYTDPNRLLDAPLTAVAALDRLVSYDEDDLRRTIEWLDAWV